MHGAQCLGAQYTVYRTECYIARVYGVQYLVYDTMITLHMYYPMYSACRRCRPFALIYIYICVCLYLCIDIYIYVCVCVCYSVFALCSRLLTRRRKPFRLTVEVCLEQKVCLAATSTPLRAGMTYVYENATRPLLFPKLKFSNL